MANTTFQDLLDAVAGYYGSGSDQWAEIARYGVNQQTIPIIQQVPGVTVTVSNSGKYLGYDYTNPFASAVNPASAIDSNVQTGAYGAGSFNAQLPATAVTDPSTGTTTLQSGAKLTSSGSVVATIADRASLAITGVALGTKLGKLIDSGLYAFAPEWWDEHFPAINPETWDDIATTEGGKNFIRSLFGLQNDSATMYADERLLAYTYMMMLQNGAWGDGGKSIVIDNPDVTKSGTTYHVLSTPTYVVPAFTAQMNYAESTPVLHSASGNYEICFALSESSGARFVFLSRTPFTLISSINTSAASPRTFQSLQTEFISGYPIYYLYDQRASYSNFVNGSTVIPPQIQFSAASISDLISPYNPDALYHVLLYQSTINDNPTIPGVSENPEAGEQINPNTLINPTTGQPVTPNDNLADVLNALRTQYPDLFNDSIYEDVPQPDGTTERITYIPVPYPNTVNPTQPTSDTTPGIDPQTDPQISPNIRPQELIQQLIDTLTSPTINSPDTGDGDTPPVVPPTGNASSLWAVYNPTQGQVDAFGAWLWSSNFVDQIKKLFADPMQGIIGLHKIFATPATGGAQNIKVGYLDSGVSSAVVTNQYTTVDCGTVNVAEYFGNVFDYEDTQIRLYLPFIGIVDLSTSDVMRGSVQVVYHVDVITGACLADVNVYRDGGGGVLYQYSGDAAVRYPVSSGSYMGMVSGVLAVVGGIASVATGGALAPAVMGAVSGVMHSKTDVKHSGNFSGAAGAMGAKIPYLIIERPQTAVANGYINYQGIGDNRIAPVGILSGYFKMTDVHTDNVLGATGAEIEQIKTALERGVIQ